MFTLHFFRALVTSLRALSQNKARFWLFYLLIRTEFERKRNANVAFLFIDSVAQIAITSSVSTYFVMKQLIHAFRCVYIEL